MGVEESVSESFVSMVLKLSEDELRPLFLKIAHWKASAAVEDAGKKGKKKGGALARRMAFFRVVNHLAEKLRVSDGGAGVGGVERSGSVDHIQPLLMTAHYAEEQGTMP